MSVKSRLGRLEKRLSHSRETDRPWEHSGRTEAEWHAFINGLRAKIREVWQRRRVGPENPEAASNMRRSKDLGERR